MGLGKKLEQLDAKVDEVLMHPTSPAYPNADRLEITYPGDDAVWTPAEEIDVTWDLLGDVSGRLEVSLVRQTGDQSGANFGQLAFFMLASGVDPAKKKVTIQVPEVPAGSDYAISISNDDPLTVYSPAITIAEPA
ncbi:Ser-Thr-rich GPI-anchored membrane family protein [Catenulispora subtropica]|uniref:Yeast cell wall synthesis Kre9/Knh1-like N-terminal domain-containing protein n=1 Tax=Catenulispora subtropica TaxID=450798 RepID=A0ABN2QLF6_9ACTN